MRVTVLVNVYKMFLFNAVCFSFNEYKRKVTNKSCNVVNVLTYG